jgi:cytochrome P450
MAATVTTWLGKNGFIALQILSSRAFFRDPVGYAALHPSSVLDLASPSGRAALVRDPDEAWRILVTDADRFRQGKWKRRAARFLGATLNTLDGEEHRARRLLLQPVLDRKRVAPQADGSAARAFDAQTRWQDGDNVVLRETLDSLALVIAGDVLLGTDLEPQAGELVEALSTIMSSIPRLTPPLPFTPQGRALAKVHAALRVILRSASGRPTDGTDLIAILSRSDLPEHIVLGELTAVLLAAVDEPASGLAAAWYLLACHPDAEERFHAELDSAVGDGLYSPSETPNLPYLEAVLSESLRLYPPARHVDRCPVADATICDKRVRAGTNLLVSPLVMHHESALFASPAEFLPERWLDDRPRPMRGAYLPFGAGPHTCIGEPLARLIMTTTLATIGSRWRLRVDDNVPTPTPGLSDLEVVLERRCV